MQHIIPVDLDRFPEGFHSEVLTLKTGISDSMVLFSRVPPGHHGPKLHTHAVDQVYYTVSGSMKVQLGTDVYTVTPGTTVLIPAGTPHCNWNDGDEDELHLELFSPFPGTDPAVIVRPAEPRHVPGAEKLVRKISDEGFLDISPGFKLHPLVQRDTGSKEARLYYAELAPASGGPELHFHDFDQFYFVLNGSLEVQIGNKKMTAGPKSLVVLPAGTVHANFNPGPGNEQHIAIITPEPARGERFDYGVEIVADPHRNG
ncbi:cupin domain-containing protein [Bradyrhizobium sp. ma5]|uniref:cupin domain-containing protein n=1 Tax=Bradyrhizobium sp. ma5 TaxID=3344828 RepID=UPI0035D515DB